MKTNHIPIFGLVLLLSLFGCKKKVADLNIQVIGASYMTGTFYHFISGPIEVNLMQGGQVLDTRYTGSGGIANMGTIKYGAYSIRVTGTKMVVNTQNATTSNDFVEKTVGINVDDDLDMVIVNLP